MTIGNQGTSVPLPGAALGGAVSSYATPGATSGAAATPRMRELMSGSPPLNAAEQLWVTKVGQAFQSYLNVTRAIINEGTRQAAMGNDIYGRPKGATVAGAGMEDSTWEMRVTQLVNVERAKYGLGALSYSRQLDAAAESHNRYQVATLTMAHEGLGDADPGSRIRATGFAGAWGENVATGQRSPEQVVAEWMASPGHRRNILDPNFKQVGVSYATAANGRTFWAQEFGA